MCFENGCECTVQEQVQGEDVQCKMVCVTSYMNRLTAYHRAEPRLFCFPYRLTDRLGCRQHLLPVTWGSIQYDLDAKETVGETNTRMSHYDE